MHNKPFHAPVKHPKRVLDIGCGTGSMTIQLAQRFPEAQVIGLDISPVPPMHNKPTNVQYIQGDIRELAKNAEWAAAFDPEGFGYIFSRFLLFGVPDWPAHIANIASLLAPGGWVELQEPEMGIYGRDELCISDDWYWQRQFLKDCSAYGFDIVIGKKLAQYMGATGLVNIQETKYKWPVAVIPAQPETNLMLEINKKQNIPMQEHLLKKVCKDRHTAEELERMKEEMRKTVQEYKEGDHARLFVAVGQKPIK